MYTKETRTHCLIYYDEYFSCFALLFLLLLLLLLLLFSFRLSETINNGTYVSQGAFVFWITNAIIPDSPCICYNMRLGNIINIIISKTTYLVKYHAESILKSICENNAKFMWLCLTLSGGIEYISQYWILLSQVCDLVEKMVSTLPEIKLEIRMYLSSRSISKILEVIGVIFFFRSWSHRLRPKKLHTSVAVPGAPVRVPSQGHLPRLSR